MNSLPFVSVVMPVRNEADFIDKGLAAIWAQDYPAERMEVIIADGMSQDGTRDLVLQASAARANVRLIDNSGKIVSTGLNAAMQHARGEIIIRIDGHCEVAPDYVSQCVSHLENNNVDGVGGPIETIGQTFWSRAIAVAMSSSFGVGGSAFRTIKDRKMIVETIPFPAYRRLVMERAGLFDEELVRDQDDEYNYRLRKLGFKLLLSPEIRSRYYSRSSLSSLWRQYFQYGYWKVRVMQKHARQMRPRQFVPAIFVASLICSLIAAPFSSFASTILLLLTSAYLVANLVFSVLAAAKTDWRLLPALPVTFATLHFAYGFGFIRGLVAFRKRWHNLHLNGTGLAHREPR